MVAYDLIFSDNTAQRIKRHLLFWLVFSIYIFIFRFYVVDMKYLLSANTYIVRLEDLLLFIPLSIFAAYFAMYFLLPRYILAGRYRQLAVVIIVASLVLIALSYLLSIGFNIRLAWDLPLVRAPLIRKVDFTLNNGVVYPLTVSGFAIAIKMTKHFYLQQKQNERLGRQKIEAEVQLLKSQVHPRFLFNSLNSIHDDMLHGAKHSPEMLLKLSDLLSYVLYESDIAIPLTKEMALLRNYIDLEQIKWGNNLAVTISEDLETEEKYIEPLLLLPLIEYIFTNAEKNLLQQVDLTLQMHEKGNTLYFMAAAKWKDGKITPIEDVQVVQVKKRLQAQYPGRHTFNIVSGAGSLTISLSVHL